MGLVLAALALTGRVAWLSRFFTRPVVKGVQLGVGLMLIQASVGLIAPGGHHLSVPAQAAWRLPAAADFAPALWLLVIPQLPLTLGNAVFAVSETAREYFGAGSRRAEPTKIALSLSIANLAMGLFGGLPVCHGSGGLTAHYRFGARSAGATLITGAACILLGCFGGQAFPALKTLPAWLLGAMVLYVGFCHVALAAKVSEGRATSLAMGLAGLATGNLAYALALGLAMENLPGLCRLAEAPQQ
jgi:SulP family sulfate permease